MGREGTERTSTKGMRSSSPASFDSIPVQTLYLSLIVSAFPPLRGLLGACSPSLGASFGEVLSSSVLSPFPRGQTHLIRAQLHPRSVQ